MISKDLARKIRYIQIYTSKSVNDVMAGEYKSAFKGSGMEFDEVREYQPGDEVRSIDWNVTARHGHPFVKRFHEERELTVIFLVDMSASGRFGSCSRSKAEVSAELCALLSFSAVKNNDKVGMMLFTDRVERFIPPAKGVSHAMGLISEVMGFQPKGVSTDIGSALEYLGKVMRRRCVVFLVSDFLGLEEVRHLRAMSVRHDLIAVNIVDRREQSLPDVGLLELEDAETGEIILVDTGSEAVRSAYSGSSAAEHSRLKSLFRSMNVDLLEINTSEEYSRKLMQFFQHRNKHRQ